MKTKPTRLSTAWPFGISYALPLGGLLFLVQTAPALDLLVYNNNDRGAGSLRQAINDNNALGGGNNIIISNVVTGTITLTTGELLISKDVTIVGPGAALLAVNGNASSRVFHITNSTVTISGLTISNGHAANVSPIPEGSGGGIFSDDSTLTASNCVLSGNSASYYGGGIYIYDSSGSASLTVTACAFTGNSADEGGGISTRGSSGSAALTVTASTFSGNSANSGGGIYNGGNSGGATLIVKASTFSGNSATVGGGIFNDGLLDSAALTVTASTFSRNSASGGGGIYNNGYRGSAPLMVKASTFSGNSASVGGGGSIYIADSALKIGNTVLKTGVLSGGGNLYVDNSTVTSDGYNLCSDDGGGFLTAVSDQINTEPMLGPLQDNGGPTPTIAPLPGSPAIDQGKSLGLTTDQRGRPRSFDNLGTPNAAGGDGSDIGAVELNYFPSVTVLNTNDSGDGSLRVAILEVTNAGTINFASNVTGTVTLTTGELLIGRSVNIIGPCAKQLTVSGHDASRVFHITSGTVNLAGLTIAHGKAIVPDFGGGILNSGTLNLSNCFLTANSATTTNSSGNGGGAILNSFSGALTLSGCTVSDNFSQYGGGLYNQGALTGLDCTISANSSSIASTIYSSGSLFMKGCTVASNNVAAGGGGLQNDAGVVTLANTLIAANRATNNLSPDVFGTFVSLGYNLISTRDGSVGLTNGINSDQVGSIAAPLDPLLGPLTDNGGCTPTHALRSGSPAIDKGKSSGLTADQRGAPRPYDLASVANASGGDGSDIGAFEFAVPALHIRKPGSAVEVSWPFWCGDFSLRQIVGLNGTVWSTPPEPPNDDGTKRFIIVNPPTGSRFYRLVKP